MSVDVDGEAEEGACDLSLVSELDDTSNAIAKDGQSGKQIQARGGGDGEMWRVGTDESNLRYFKILYLW